MGRPDICRVLREEPDLAEGIAPADRARAIEDCVARAAKLAPGDWSAQHSDPLNNGIGLLVLSGLLIRRVGIEGRFGAELLGEGDLLRPWQGEEEPPALPQTTGWRVLQPTRVALLDDRFACRVALYPPVVVALVGRALQRSRNLAVNMAIHHQARVDVRLHMLFWHLAGRWGRVRSDGIGLPMRLTHTLLAELVAARRPTVTSALAELANRGVLSSVEDGWLLSGDPPGELLELAPVPPSLTAQAPPEGAPKS